MSLVLSPTTDQAVQSLRQKYANLRVQVKRPIEFSEPGLRLDLESRKADPVRSFKHLQQTCLLHTQGFITANQIKLVYLLDAYIQMVDHANPIGIYSAARGLLEFNAFLFDVTDRLLSLVNGDQRQWKSRGEEFFGLIIRARFSTSDPSKANLLVSNGISKKHLRPFNITDSIRRLSLESGFIDITAHYALLCDFVHHNLSSQTVSNVGTFVSDRAKASGGGTILMKTTAPITRYDYPATSKIVKAAEETATVALRNAEGALGWLNRCPESPFNQSEIYRMTGTRFGMIEHHPSNRVQSSRVESKRAQITAGRNDPCPCGSGKKFKRCCLGLH